MTKARWIRSVAMGSMLWCSVSSVGFASEPCRISEELVVAMGSLPRVAATLKSSQPLRVLAVGSATMFGPEASFRPGTVTNQALNNRSGPPPTPAQPITEQPSERAFPLQMARMIKAALPGADVQVVVRGGRGMTAIDMLNVIKKEMTPGAFQLVLWQTGTVEAVRNSPPGDFAQTLSDGAEIVEGAQANLILIDPQYSRFLQVNSNLDPYTQALQQTASMPGVMLFHRFELMRTWANDGLIDLERTPKADRQKVGDALHACLGAHLARLVLAGARS